MVFGFSEIDFPITRLPAALGVPRLVMLRQVHGAEIHEAEHCPPGTSGDGLVVCRPGTAVVIATADCVPLFFWHEGLAAAGVLHIGWRGLQAGIECRLKDWAERLGLSIGDFYFFLGPAIAGECYEVGEDVASAFAARPEISVALTPHSAGGFHLDIKAGIRLSLARMGVEPRRVDDCRLCTHCLPGRFPSYRRDGKTGKRIYNFLVLDAAV